jgi:uncharacterized membrane protein
MSYKAKKTIVSILTGVFLLVAYVIYVIGKVQSGAAAWNDLKFWAITMLAFIGIGVVVMIIIQIIFHILMSIAVAVQEQMRNGQCDDKAIEKQIELEMVEDEMDKLIELKSMRISFGIVGAGFVLALGSLALGWPPAVMLNVLFGSFSIGSMIEGFAQIHYYSKGIKNS